MKVLRFPIRVKILITLLLVVTGAVGTITFTMANRFQEDKRAYLDSLASMYATGAAEESRSILMGYQERLRVHARIIRDPSMEPRVKAEILSSLFHDFPELSRTRSVVLGNLKRTCDTVMSMHPSPTNGPITKSRPSKRPLIISPSPSKRPAH